MSLPTFCIVYGVGVIVVLIASARIAFFADGGVVSPRDPIAWIAIVALSICSWLTILGALAMLLTPSASEDE